MSRITGSRQTYGHRIFHVSGDHYKISWTFDTKIKGSRLRWPRTMTRHTNEEGARRFAKKWELPFPETVAK